MANIAVINCISLSRYAFLPLNSAKNSEQTAFQCVLEYASALPDISSIYCIRGKDTESLPSDSQQIKIVSDISSVAELMSSLADIATELSSDDSVIYFYGDTPLLDPELTVRMLDNHRRYRADFTFADAYPVGLAPEILRSTTIGPLAGLAKDMQTGIRRDTIFEVLRKDINAFEIETEIPPLDLRLLRIALTADDKAGYGLLCSLMEDGPQTSIEILNKLNENQKPLRTLPYYLSVQVTAACPQECSYCPYPSIAGDAIKSDRYMPLESFQNIINQFVSFADTGYVNLSPWGEPSMHPEIEAIIDAVCSRGLRAVIETSGLGWDGTAVSALSEKYGDLITWIVSLDAHSEAVYRKLRGAGFAEAKLFFEKLLALFPGTAFVQAVRMDTNEEELELFYRYWKEKTENIIIQKYDYFSGCLPQRRIADISPYNRNACWHMKRDITVLLNGDVPVCREDIKSKYILGNVLTDGIESVWEKGREYYEKQLNGDLLEICRECDEYYTYNY